MELDLFSKAINPSQYDGENISWASHEACSHLGTRPFFLKSLLPYASLWNQKSALDIGCGTGWFVNEMKKTGASKAIGFDPSLKNIDIGKNFFPEVVITLDDLSSFSSEEPFNFINCNFVFEHLPNLDSAFTKINQLLLLHGSFILIVGDYTHFRTARPGRLRTIEDINPFEYVEKTLRNDTSGSFVNIIRKLDFYLITALRFGFEIVEHVPLFSDSSSLFSSHFSQSGCSIAHLIHFKKISSL